MRVLLVDDHTIFRQGLKFLLTDLDDKLAFIEAGTAAQALSLVKEEQPELVLLDLNLPGTRGLELLTGILDAAPGIPVAILSGAEDPSLIRSTIDAGASGFVPKTADSEVLVSALRLILSGGIYLPGSALRTVTTGASANEDERQAIVDKLSGRQTSVLLRAIQGQANKVIALEPRSATSVT